uniref:Uncharacterized protein n=1 Tax=Plectus sambesii TaxID=2011161 RepID=A0A914UND4_9BILA
MSDYGSPSESLNLSHTHNRDGSLLRKKQNQWAKERAEGSDAWFPFGRPGAGAPNRSSGMLSKSASSGQLNGTSRWSSVENVAPTN